MTCFVLDYVMDVVKEKIERVFRGKDPKRGCTQPVLMMLTRLSLSDDGALVSWLYGKLAAVGACWYAGSVFIWEIFSNYSMQKYLTYGYIRKNFS